jgi:hypothetical protein
MKMKKLGTFASFTLVASVLTGCGNTSPSQVKVESRTQETHTSGSATTDETPATNSPPITVAQPESKPPVAKAADLPAEVVLEANYDGEAKLSPFTSGKNLMTMLDASIKITTETPGIGKVYRLMQAKTVKFISPDIGNCALSQRNFNTASADSKSGFTFMGSDTTGGEMACAGFLMTAKSEGMVIEFSDVPVSQISDASIPKVTLKISPSASN